MKLLLVCLLSLLSFPSCGTVLQQLPAPDKAAEAIDEQARLYNRICEPFPEDDDKAEFCFAAYRVYDAQRRAYEATNAVLKAAQE